MTTVDRTVDLARINAEARDVQFSRVALTIIARVLWAVGAVTYHAFRFAWLVIAWCAVAVKVGWQDARTAHQKPPPRT